MSVVYLAGSLGGIAALVAFCAVLFGIRSAKIPPSEALEAYMAQRIPGFRARAIAADAAAALVENHDGLVHLIVTRGDCLVSRALSRGALRSVKRDGAALVLRLADFTLPSVRLGLRDDDLAILWEARLKR